MSTNLYKPIKRVLTCACRNKTKGDSSRYQAAEMYRPNLCYKTPAQIISYVLNRSSGNV